VKSKRYHGLESKSKRQCLKELLFSKVKTNSPFPFLLGIMIRRTSWRGGRHGEVVL
jgi:hypothetical protein